VLIVDTPFLWLVAKHRMKMINTFIEKYKPDPEACAGLKRREERENLSKTRRLPGVTGLIEKC